MKYILLLIFIACSLTSCFTFLSRKRFTYRSDGQTTGIYNQLRIDGYFVSDTIVSYPRPDYRNISLEQIHIYTDGSFNTANLHFANTGDLHSFFETNLYRHMHRDLRWGQCRVLADTLFVQKMVLKGTFFYGISMDTFIIHADTLLEQVGRDSYGRNRSLYHFRCSSVKPDSSWALIRERSWYWTKGYRDSINRRGIYKKRN